MQNAFSAKLWEEICNLERWKFAFYTFYIDMCLDWQDWAQLGEPSGHFEEPYWIKRNEAPKHLYIVLDPKYACNLLYDYLIHKN